MIVKESDLNQGLQNFIDKATPNYGLMVRDENGTRRIDPLQFKSHFEAEFWQTNITNVFAMDSQGKEIKGSIIVDLKKRSDA